MCLFVTVNFAKDEYLFIFYLFFIFVLVFSMLCPIEYI